MDKDMILQEKEAEVILKALRYIKSLFRFLCFQFFGAMLG